MRIGVAGVGRIGAFHARTLQGLDQVDSLVLADAVPGAAEKVAAELGVESADSVEALLASGLDGFVIAAGTPAHASLIRAGVEAGIPTFCEKPAAMNIDETLDLLRLEESTDVPVHIGFQRRFDSGYRRAQQAVAAGELGFVHTITSWTFDAHPPHLDYIPTSGGIFRDCNIHDYDILRFVTGREVVRVYTVGSNKGDPFFTESGDVDSGASLLTFDDGTTAFVASTRYHGSGHDVRMEVHGSKGALSVGLDDSLAVASAQEGVTFPAGPPVWSFMERFQPAYVAELTAFADVAAGRLPSPCTIRDGLEAARIADACQLSKDESRPVDLTEIRTA
ncbi:MAG: Gfo/Idh/MocA family oxidoreductase [Dermatophilus congolensis]|nr:Gfo/Idh/MocA family oxidoreductase [Dermatophilus congolensis]